MNDPPCLALAEVSQPSQVVVAGLDRFNLLVKQVQNLAVAIQAIHPIPALHSTTPLLQTVPLMPSQPLALSIPMPSLVMQYSMFGVAPPSPEQSLG